MSNAFVDQLRSRAAISSEAQEQLRVSTSRVSPIAMHSHIVRQRDTPVGSFALLSGWACCYTSSANGSRQIIRLMMAGDYWESHPDVSFELDYGIAALTSAQVAFIPASAVKHLLLPHADIALALYRTRVRDEAITRTWLSRLARRDAMTVLTHLLCELCVRAGKSTGEITMPLPLTQTVLADATAMTAVHLNRILKLCRERELCSLQQGILRVKNYETLASAAGFAPTYLRTKMSA